MGRTWWLFLGLLGCSQGGGSRTEMPNGQHGFKKQLLRTLVRHKSDALLDCFDRALVRKPWLTGTLHVRLIVAPSGEVTNASGSGLDPVVARCAADVLAILEFPNREGDDAHEEQVIYPLTFTP